MNQDLKIPDAVYTALVAAAEASGATPVEWIVAHLPLPVQHSGLSSEPDNGQAAPPVEETDELADARPWRGVYSPTIPRTVLFEQEMEIGMADLQRGKPTISVNTHHMESDDECELV